MDADARPTEFGYFLVPDADRDLLATARRVEALGFDYLAVQDHPYQRRFVDTWALLAMVAGQTTTLRLFPDVANLPLRPPAMLAKAAATIDALSGGRFELGLGAGAFWDAIEAYGGPRRTPGGSLAALEEAIAVIRKVWSGERNLRFDGEHYRLAGAQSGPVPTHPIGIWLGVHGPRALALTGRLADGWVPSLRGDLDQLAVMVDRLDTAASDAGRDPDDIKRILNVHGTITDGASEGPLHGPPDQWIDQLEELRSSHRFDTFVLWADEDGQAERFAHDIMPVLRP